MSSHWDREWYQPFQYYRYRLVQLLDRVIEGLDDGRMRGPFTTDGQTIVLDDYLEIRPEKTERVKELVREGKIVTGPWYVLPDEFLVSGESIIRNIRLGKSMARRYGAEPSLAGWFCDLFGHNSQMPQIMRNFGITGGFLWRGLDTLDAHWLWRGADGSELVCYRFGRRGYCTFTMSVRNDRDETPPDLPFIPEEFQKRFTAELDIESERSDIDSLLFFDGADHNEWDTDAYAEIVKRMDDAPSDFEIVHSTLDAYIAEMQAQASRITHVVEGEQREVGSYNMEIDQSWLIHGVLSSRVWIKQANAECENLLTRWAEPASALASALLPREYPTEYLNVAWKWLLQNHPHDSICGCSVDTVHEDMKYRFSQARQIGNKLTDSALESLAVSVDQALGDDELRVLAFNPIARPQSGPIELTLNIPASWPTFQEFFGFERKPGFRIYDASGTEVSYQVLMQDLDNALPRFGPPVMPTTHKVHFVKVAIDLKLPATGYRTLTVRPIAEGEWVRHPLVPGFATADNAMANEHLSVEIAPNGSLKLTDLATGESYDRLLTFEDIADIGDGWFHGVAVNDAAFSSTASRAAVALVHNGPKQTTFRVRTELEAPARFDSAKGVRSPELATTVIDSLITLRAGAKHLEVESTVYNVAEDHRLRVLFPSDVDADTYLADSAFDAVERKIALEPDNYLKRELQVETTPMQSWAAVSDKNRGLAVISAGQLEVAVRDLPARPLTLTLFRGTRRTIFTAGEPNGELLGELKFRYWIAPVKGEPDRTELFEMGQKLAAGVRSAQVMKVDINTRLAPRFAERVPAEAGLFSVTGPAVVTSSRYVAGGFEVRLFNPKTSAIDIKLQVAEKLSADTAQLVDFESLPMGTVSGKSGVYDLRLEPKKIVTVRVPVSA